MTKLHGEYCFLDTTAGISNVSVILMGNSMSDQNPWRVLFPGYHYQGQYYFSVFHWNNISLQEMEVACVLPGQYTEILSPHQNIILPTVYQQKNPKDIHNCYKHSTYNSTSKWIKNKKISVMMNEKGKSTSGKSPCQN